MKIKTYSITGACPPLWKSDCIVANAEPNGVCPIVYLRRPKWIKDDAAWKTLCKSIRLELPAGFELK
jgi:hypothetical protein